MNSKPLSNPVARDVRQFEDIAGTQENVAQKYTIPREQLPLPHQSRRATIQQYRSSWIDRLKTSLRHLQAAPFWNKPAHSFLLVSICITLLALLFGGLLVYQNTDTLQLFYNPVNETWERLPTYWHFVLIPILLLLVGVLQIRLLTHVFNVDRRLSITISWVSVLITLFLLIAVSQIYSLNPVS